MTLPFAGNVPLSHIAVLGEWPVLAVVGQVGEHVQLLPEPLERLEDRRELEAPRRPARASNPS